MKIALFIDSLALGGAQKHVRQVACGLAARGHPVVVYVLNAVVSPLYQEALERGGVVVRVLGKAKVASGCGLLQAAVGLRRDGCDVIVTVLYVSTLFGRALSIVLGGVPVVTCLQARNIDYTATQKFLLRTTAGLTRLTISNSRSAIAWATQHEGVVAQNCVFVANALDSNPPRAAAESETVRTWAALGFPQLEGKRVIGSLGRLHGQKGYDILLEAFAEIAEKYTEWVVLLVGGGPERKALLDQAHQLGLSGRVWLAGERTETRYLLEKMDIYVQPSRAEGTPNALMEAMALGLPVVATAVDGISELIEPNREGWLVPEDNAAALALALASACGQPSLRQSYGERAGRRVAGQFSTTALVDNFERALAGLAR